ncbi:MAG TPA: hypothetical protein VEH07_02350 [Alphaproteobacteria bacterium]|nr:hypothetical protein [Alphaproteobacteria bacterium]
MMVRGLMIAIALSLAAGTALADSKDDVLQAMIKCADTSSKKARLKCFDAASPALRALYPRSPEAAPATPVASGAPAAPSIPAPATAAAATPAAPVSAVASAQPTPEQQKSWFGLHLGAHKQRQTEPAQFGGETVSKETKAAEGMPEPPKEIDEISATLTDYAKTSFGKIIVFLDNGQVWRQAESDSGSVLFKSKPGDNKVVISRGPFNSYSMIVNKGGALIKVQRIK